MRQAQAQGSVRKAVRDLITNTAPGAATSRPSVGVTNTSHAMFVWGDWAVLSNQKPTLSGNHRCRTYYFNSRTGARPPSQALPRVLASTPTSSRSKLPQAIGKKLVACVSTDRVSLPAAWNGITMTDYSRCRILRGPTSRNHDASNAECRPFAHRNVVTSLWKSVRQVQPRRSDRTHADDAPVSVDPGHCRRRSLESRTGERLGPRSGAQPEGHDARSAREVMRKYNDVDLAAARVPRDVVEFYSTYTLEAALLLAINRRLRRRRWTVIVNPTVSVASSSSMTARSCRVGLGTARYPNPSGCPPELEAAVRYCRLSSVLRMQRLIGSSGPRPTRVAHSLVTGCVLSRN